MDSTAASASEVSTAAPDQGARAARPSPTSDYTVRLDAFEGPLDLLLFLIRRAEVEITDIPIAVIADQYLDYLRHLDTIDIDRAGEFLVMAATLTEIKARMLAPPQPAGGDGSDGSGGQPGGASSGRGGQAGSGGGGGGVDLLDPRAELIRQLLDYKKFRDAAAALDGHRREWESRFPAARAGIDRAALADAHAAEARDLLDMDDVTLADLAEAFARLLDTVDLTRIGEHHVTVDETPIETHAADILECLQRAAAAPDAPAPPHDSPPPHATEPGWVPFATIFRGRTRAEMIGLFLAMLELVRQRRIRVAQAGARAEIILALADEAALPEVPVEQGGTTA
jgi:segregation and condensation protein A